MAAAFPVPVNTMQTLAPLPDFGPRLKRLRRAHGIKQAALADMAGVDQTTVSRWEAGRILPSARMQRDVLRMVGGATGADAALRRLVEHSADCLHLVDDASHRCLAYSRGRAEEWQVSQSQMLGEPLWRFATDEIRQAEADLDPAGWWETHLPAPRHFVTSAARHAEIRIREGLIVWERMYLADGTPVRLVSGARAPG